MTGMIFGRRFIFRSQLAAVTGKGTWKVACSYPPGRCTLHCCSLEEGGWDGLMVMLHVVSCFLAAEGESGENKSSARTTVEFLPS